MTNNKNKKYYDFEKDTKESKEFIMKHMALGNEQFGYIDQGGFFEIARYKIKSRSWWILFIPFHVKSKILEAIEYKYYAPNSGKNAGLELVPLFDYQVTVAFCHKSCMNGDQLTELIHKMTDVVDPERKLTEERDIIPLMEFKEPETHEWIMKIEKLKRDTYEHPENIEHLRVKDTIEGMREYGIPVRTKNPKVIEEIKVYHKMSELLDQIHDYYLKQEESEK